MRPRLRLGWRTGRRLELKSKSEDKKYRVLCGSSHDDDLYCKYRYGETCTLIGECGDKLTG